MAPGNRGAAAAEPNAKNWCVVVWYGGVYADDNTPRPTREEALSLLEDLQELANYLIAGDEVCPTTGQTHFQCYVQLISKQRRSALLKIIPRVKWIVATGTDEDNFIYCSKEGKFQEYGERRDTTGGRQGAEREKKRWKETRTAAETGRLDQVDDQIYVQHYAALKSIAKDNLKMPADANGTTGVWFYGSSGTGKSRTARLEYPGSYLKLANKWFDGYNPAVHKTIILDDLDKNHSVLCYHLKIWADRYAFLAETKGGAIAIRPETVVVTSQYSIEEIFGPDEAAIEAIRRRFKVRHFSAPFGMPQEASASALVANSNPGMVETFNPPESLGSSLARSVGVGTNALDSVGQTADRDAVAALINFTQAPTQIVNSQGVNFTPAQIIDLTGIDPTDPDY
jgi:Putative viral replication protein